MKPDAYIPLYYRDFFEAVKPYPPDVGIAYLKAICHYVGHLHCKGIDNDDEQMRRLCEIERLEWARVKAVIFDNEHFFILDGEGRWHQKRAEEEYRKSIARYEAAVSRGRKGASSRWK